MGDAKIEAFLPSYLEDNGLVRALRNAHTSFSQRREALGLSNPGTVENISREVQKDVFLTRSMFTGLRADFNRPLSMTPLFQYSHAFALGSQGIPPYGFTALLGSSRVSNTLAFVELSTLIMQRYSCRGTSTMMGS